MEKIATIEVYLSDEDGFSASNFDPDTKHGEVRLLTKNSDFPIKSKSDLADILAHELGHIVGRVFELPTQMQGLQDRFFRRIIGGPVSESEYESEKEAWDYAGKMRPINPRIRNPRLKTYKDGMAQ